MDFVNQRKRIAELFHKYKYAGIILLIGIVFMILPGKETVNNDLEEKQAKVVAEEPGMEERLENILCRVSGAGQVKVMLSVAKGESSVYQTDSTYSQTDNNTDTRTQTILVTDSNRNETGLVYQKNPPTYLGAIILAQGAENPQVKLALVDAVMDVTGLGADKISVLKMQ